MDKLKSCPFCGRASHLSVCDAGGIELTEGDVFRRKISTWQVYCGYCGACGPGVIDKTDRAVEAWNRRAGDTDAD